MAEAPDEFFVGYLPETPPATRSLLRRVVAALAVVAVVVPLLAWAGLSRLPSARFEFGVEREFRGVLQERPVPALAQLAGNDGTAPATARWVPLVAPGKHGADGLIAGLDGQSVSLTGTLIERDRQTMIELVPGSLRVLPAATLPKTEVEDLGPLVVRGEIVDTKCHLGVMNPGQGKVHRGCAARCLSGGVPAALHVELPGGEVRNFLLLDPAGRPLGPSLLDRVAEPVEVTGRGESRGGLYFLHTEPGAIRRLAAEG